MIAAALGLLLGAGLVLVASPRLWPRGGRGAPARSRPPAALRGLLVRAGLDRASPAVFLALSGLLGIAAGAAAAGLLRVPALGLVAGCAAAAAPVLLVSTRARQRRRAARAAWPDLVDHLVAGLRAGIPLGEAVASLARLAPPELRGGFATFDRALRSRGALGPALDELKEALADPVADRLVETLRVAREVGGTELPGVLRVLSSALRQEAAARAEAEARQSWVVAAARLGVAAPWIVLGVLATRPEAAGVYASPGGTVLVLVGFAVTVLAYRLMLVIGRLPEERRWFA